MMGWAPARRAAMTAASPTAPVPKMATLTPCGTFKEFIYGAGPGLKPAAQRRQKIERQVPGNPDEVAFGGEQVGGERRLAEEMAAHAAPVQGIAAVGARQTEVQLVEALATRGVSAPALTALAAGLIGEHDVIAGRDALDALADLFHHPGAFMAQDYRRPIPVIAETDIRVADARGDDSHQDFVRARPFQFEGFDLQGTAAPAEHRRLD